jgi:putative SOS response-associated peptidase YedK
MWGRVRLSTDVSELKITFPIPEGRPLPNFAPTWNGAPTDNLPVVRLDWDGRRTLDLMRRA